LDSKEKIFDLLSDIGVGLGSEMKFKSWDFGLQQISNLRKLLNRKIGIWLEDSKFKSSALNQGHLNPRLGFEFQKEDLVPWN
jgi:hypothetical protein